MSDRGSFVTEYIGCKDCLEVAKRVLVGSGQHGLGQQIIRSGQPGKVRQLPIIAGYTRSVVPGLAWQFDDDVRKELDEGLCHSLAIAVLDEQGVMVKSRQAVTLMFGPTIPTKELS